MGSWKGYVDKTAGKPARKDLIAALKRFKRGTGLSAADLGAGAGNETLHLLRRGWKVLALDSRPYAVATIRRRAREESLDGLKAHVQTLQSMRLGQGRFDT